MLTAILLPHTYTQGSVQFQLLRDKLRTIFNYAYFKTILEVIFEFEHVERFQTETDQSLLSAFPRKCDIAVRLFNIWRCPSTFHSAMPRLCANIGRLQARNKFLSLLVLPYCLYAQANKIKAVYQNSQGPEEGEEGHWPSKHTHHHLYNAIIVLQLATMPAHSSPPRARYALCFVNSW